VSERSYPHQTRIRVHDVDVAVHSNDPTFPAEVERVFFGRPRTDREPAIAFEAWVDRRLTIERKHVLFRRGREQAVIVTAFYPGLLPAIETELIAELHRRCTDVVLIGAACVAWQDAGCLLIADDANLQSQLARQLVRAGCGFYADRIALAQADGRVTRLAKSIRIERLRHPLLTRIRQMMPFRGVTMNSVDYFHPGPTVTAEDPPPVAIRHVIEVTGERVETPVLASASRNLGLLVKRMDSKDRMDVTTFDLLHRMASAAEFHTLRPSYMRPTVEAVLGLLRRTQSAGSEPQPRRAEEP
jgi:hypothetical protein